ncbi:hypothetical protein [Streptomyces acidicola]|uniref:Uncharacterized protein n=1 Tax=Streptomyces acidicola TaxID=2596892 RepID=A0A5N8X671_9ACTN|nr:hypothetical protein [Streptomyces acidicola]MPY54950.1 hypothetical protein [Streptomyces acidicola]
MPYIHAALITGVFALVAAVTGTVVTYRLALRAERKRLHTESPQIVVIPVRSRWWRWSEGRSHSHTALGLSRSWSGRENPGLGFE